MKKTLIVILFALFQIACVETIYAQNLPKTVTVSWDASPITENVTSYDVTLDGGTPVAVIATVAPSSPVVLNTYGHHIISVVAKNATIVCDDPTQCNTVQVTSSLPSNLGLTLSASASTVKNVKLK